MKSIRARLTLRLCLAMGGLFLLCGAGVFLGMGKLLEISFDETLAAKARALVTASEVDDGDFEIDLTVQDFAGFGRGGDDYFEIRRAGGGLVLRSPSLRGPTGVLDRFAHFGSPEPGASRIIDGRLADGRAARIYLEWIYPKDDEERRYQDLYLIAASPKDPIQKPMKALAWVLAASGVAALLVMVPVLRSGLARGLRPLRELSDEVTRIKPDDLGRRLDAAPLPEELRPMADALNGWLSRLEESFERERRFSAHAAHELRTPLAEIRAIAELGEKWEEEATPARCAEIVAVCGELEALLGKLSLLARADSGRYPVFPEPCDPQAMVKPVLYRLKDRAEARGIRFDVQVAGGEVLTDPVLWNAVFQNLAGNAVSHSPARSTVTVRVSEGNISVANPAPELSEEDLPRLFERFWSKESGRGREHSGLGLPLVRACAGLLGGTSAARLEEGELVVEVRF